MRDSAEGIIPILLAAGEMDVSVLKWGDLGGQHRIDFISSIESSVSTFCIICSGKSSSRILIGLCSLNLQKEGHQLG